MRIQIDGWEFFDSVKAYLSDKHNYELDTDEKEVHFNFDIDAKPNLYRYEKDTKWNDEKIDFDIINEYEVDGLYVKRKKKGSEKYQYVKLDEDCYPTMKSIHEDTEVNINIF